MNALIPLALAIQVAQASVTGSVRDRLTGELLPAAIVTLTDVDRRTATGDGGRYTFNGVQPGPHHLTVELAGFETRTLHALVPRQGTLELHIALRPDPIRLSPVKTELLLSMPGNDPAATGRGRDRTITLAAVRNHPLLAEADVFAALESGDVALQPESPNGLHIRGGAADHTSYELDGLPVLSPYHGGGVFSSWNPDALASIGVSSGSEASSALGGVVSATTRAPDESLGGRMALSSRQARFAFDGPVGAGDASFLVSMRSGFPSSGLRPSDPSYVRHELGDLLAKVEAPLGGGRLRLLTYQGESEAHVGARTLPASPNPTVLGSNLLDWTSGTTGMTWSGTTGAGRLEVRGWRAASGVEGLWTKDGSEDRLDNARADLGILAVLEVAGLSARTSLGIRGERRTTRYHYGPGDDRLSRASENHNSLLTLFGAQTRTLGDAWTARAGMTLTAGVGRLFPAPAVDVTWNPLPSLTLGIGATRQFQFTQSLRNGESVATNIFLADLPVAADGIDVPVARADQVMIDGAFEPVRGTRLRAALYARRLDDLVLVPVSTGDPFGSDGLQSGSGTVAGFSVDAGVTGARYGLMAGYGWQRVRSRASDIGFAPAYAPTHRTQVGATVFATPTFSVRLGTTAAWGRRATPFDGFFEWESCTLTDRGCEFFGTPTHDPTSLGVTTLPAYVRADLGIRKHWHLDLRAVQGVLGLYGTVTNVFGRENILGYGEDPATGHIEPISMAPLAPLVLGLDWRF